MTAPTAIRPMIEIDHYGERLIGCIGCNRWGWPGDTTCLGAQRLGGYLFLGMLAFTVDLTWPLDSTFVLPFSAFAAAAIRVSALSVSAARRASCVALRWLARRLISLALFVLSIGSFIDGQGRVARSLQQRGSDPDHQLMPLLRHHGKVYTIHPSSRALSLAATHAWAKKS